MEEDEKINYNNNKQKQLFIKTRTGRKKTRVRVHEWRTDAVRARVERWCSRVPRWSRVTLTRCACAPARVLTNVRRPPVADDTAHHATSAKPRRSIRHAALFRRRDMYNFNNVVSSLHTFCRRNDWPGACDRHDATAVVVPELRREAFRRDIVCGYFSNRFSRAWEPGVDQTWFFPFLLTTATTTTIRRRRRLRRMCFLTTFGLSPPHLRHPFSHKQFYVVVIINENTHSRKGTVFILLLSTAWRLRVRL